VDNIRTYNPTRIAFFGYGSSGKKTTNKVHVPQSPIQMGRRCHSGQEQICLPQTGQNTIPKTPGTQTIIQEPDKTGLTRDQAWKQGTKLGNKQLYSLSNSFQIEIPGNTPLTLIDISGQDTGKL